MGLLDNILQGFFTFMQCTNFWPKFIISGACSALILLSYTVWLNCQIKNGHNIGKNSNSQNGVNDAMPNVNGGQIQNNANVIPIADCRQLQNNANEIEQHNVEGMPA